jgi:tyrosyl-tRNA synthetase
MLRFRDIKNLRNPELLERTTDQVFSLPEFTKRMENPKKLRIKYGVDVTAPFLHIGHAVNLWMMRELQEQGHTLVFLIGDFTTRIGDPTGRSDTRPVIPREEIEKNAQEFIKQISSIVLTDPAVFEVRRNSEWFETMPVDKFIGLMSMVTHARLVSRDMFQKRIEENKEIYMHEMIYPLLQGYDSVMLNSDITIVGSDQLFNENLGRFYQERFGQAPQIIITSRITPGIDGKAKQSKSLNNYIAIAHSPREKFGKAMSIPDNLIVPYLEVYTDIPLEEIRAVEKAIAAGENPMKSKKRLAAAIVARYHGAEAAAAETEWFHQAFSQRGTPQELPEAQVAASPKPIDLVQQLCPDMSRSDIRRLLTQGGVSLGDNKIDEKAELSLQDGDVLKVGKRSWFKLRVSA